MPRLLVRSLSSVAVVLLVLSSGNAPPVRSQGEEATPITIGENKIGEVTGADQAPSYVVTVLAPQSLVIQVLAVTQGFAPSLRVFDPSGVVIRAVANPRFEATVRVESLEVGAGLYRIEVQSANGQAGQFVIGVQAGAALPPPLALSLGQTVTGEARSEAQLQRYSFTGAEAEALLLYVNSVLPGAAPLVFLKDADTLETLAFTSARLAGVGYRVPAGLFRYLVEVVHSGSPVAEAYTVCLEYEDGSGPRCGVSTVVAATPVPTPTAAAFVPPPTFTPQPLPTLPPTGPCVVASLSGGAVNVRSGPGTEYAALSQLSGSALAAVIGRLPDGSWFQVDVNGVVGWIAASVIRVGGQCGGVPAVVPTAVPTATQPWTATPTPTDIPTAIPTLNFSLPPNYGSTSLTSGFVPDPFTIGMTSGGPVDVAYLGGGCSGFVTSAPDFSLNYTSGAFPTLRFYFIGSGDTTLVINTPGGSYVCVDDSFGTLNPTVDFNSPAAGRYDVWVGSYAEGVSVSGTLYVTENTGNHP